ncbi:wall-associated receptor kinase 2-like [Triticum dicoccoides]|uniref:wall-associated receptor kinase 2-like n=1 Tax=Triticum dicoccoides TaxID=85692 RepID=UPI001890554D|nr:wall-associated receptor kinase 2-like [Triticum dicoccoides]
MILLLSQRPKPKAKLLMPTVVPVLMMALLLLVGGAVVAGGPGVLPGCPEACGSIAIPYPFGIGLGCSRPGFNLTCDEKQDPPALFLGDGMEVEAISLADGTVRVRTLVKDGSFSVKPSLNSSGSWSGGLTGTGVRQLAVSTKHNIFVAIGCNSRWPRNPRPRGFLPH